MNPVETNTEVATTPVETAHERAVRTEIVWSKFLADDGVHVSLRKLVEVGGVYQRFHKAVEALQRLEKANYFKLIPFRVKAKEAGAATGATQYDWLLDYEDAILFCGKADTAGGTRLLKVLIAHHIEYQSLRQGSPEAAARLVAQMTPEAKIRLLEAGLHRTQERNRMTTMLVGQGLITEDEANKHKLIALSELDATSTAPMPAAINEPWRSISEMAALWHEEAGLTVEAAEWRLGRAAAARSLVQDRRIRLVAAPARNQPSRTVWMKTYAPGFQGDLKIALMQTTVASRHTTH